MRIHLVALSATLALASACGSSGPTGSNQSPSDGSGGSAGSAAGTGGDTSSGGVTAGSGGVSPGSGGTGVVGSGGTAAQGNGGTGAGDTGSSDSGVGGNVTACPDPGAYPAGPYGNTVGATITNLPLQGYVNATGDALSNTLPWTAAYSLQDVRKTCVPYLLIHVSDFSCPGCQHAAKQLGIDGKGILDAGGGVMDILSANALIFASTEDELNAWITTANEDVDAFIDADSDPMGALNVATVRETAFIVQVPSMQIVWLVHGDVTGTQPPSIVAAAAEMHTLLGK